MVLKQRLKKKTHNNQFENDVKMYGTQAHLMEREQGYLFENDVKMYGTQAQQASLKQKAGLRMM